jgi:hypothetical protein
MSASNVIIVTICISLLCFLTLNTVKAQAPEAINYQSVVRNIDGSPVTNQDIKVRLTIFSGEIPTTAVYTEEHDIKTNEQGLFALAIGEGAIETGDFTSIAWDSDTYHLGVEINTGEGFTSLGTLPFLSVPYSLYAKKAGNAFSGKFNDLTEIPGKLDTDSTNDLTYIYSAEIF